MATVEEYKTKKLEIEQNIENIKRDVIIAEQAISQQEAVFNEQFGTTDPAALQDISAQYIDQIAQKEQELAELSAGTATAV